jgi:hypothetical protein
MYVLSLLCQTIIFHTELNFEHSEVYIYRSITDLSNCNRYVKHLGFTEAVGHFTLQLSVILWTHNAMFFSLCLQVI